MSENLISLEFDLAHKKHEFSAWIFKISSVRNVQLLFLITFAQMLDSVFERTPMFSMIEAIVQFFPKIVAL